MKPYAVLSRLRPLSVNARRIPEQVDLNVSEAGAIPKLSIRNVSKIFTADSGAIQALAAINLTIMDGEFTCIVGPSGCGKTTLLNLIAELDSPDEGEIVLHQKQEPNFGERLLIFQEAALFPWLTVWENVAFGLRMRGVPLVERRELAMDYLALVKLERFARCYIHELSGGMKQRVALARALVLKPGILLMDEPFGALDIQTRELLYQELQESWERTKTTILFITHNVEEAVYLGDRVIIFSGRPGTVQSEHRVLSARPRQKESPYIRDLCRQISVELLRMGGMDTKKSLVCALNP